MTPGTKLPIFCSYINAESEKEEHSISTPKKKAMKYEYKIQVLGRKLLNAMKGR
jgi:hypothetical protein